MREGKISTVTHNVEMKFGPLIGWGIVIYSVTALSWAGFTLYNVSAFPLGLILQLSVLLIVTTAATRTLGFHVWPDVLPYSVTWAGIAVALDILYKVPFFGWGFFSSGSLWIGYALIIIAPLISLKKSKSHKA